VTSSDPFAPPSPRSADRDADAPAGAGHAGPTDAPADGSPTGAAAADAAAAGRDANPQFVLPLVVRIERDTPPDRTDALRTSARAVLTFLADERTGGDGEWAAARLAWEDGRIRKVVRRARGAEWRRAEALPGITVRGHEALVRVFPPVPLDAWPKDLARLQVSGTELADRPDAGAPAPEQDDPALPILWLNPAVTMSAGKAMAQTGHAAQLAWWELPDAERAAWRQAGFPLDVRTAQPQQWERLASGKLPLVRDAGFTEVAPGSSTVVADHPALRHENHRR
jgi:peptidyl-tRNA hydrolase